MLKILFFQIDSIVHPSTNGSDHLQYCHDRGRFHSPFFVYILTSFNNLCLVMNSSINFVVYCMAGRSFRNTLIKLLCHVGLPWGSPNSPPLHLQQRRRTQIELTVNGPDMDLTSTKAFQRHSINERTVWSLSNLCIYKPTNILSQK